MAKHHKQKHGSEPCNNVSLSQCQIAESDFCKERRMEALLVVPVVVSPPRLLAFYTPLIVYFAVACHLIIQCLQAESRYRFHVFR